MEKMVRKQASKIAIQLGYDAERESVIAYGLLAIEQIIITLVLVFILGLLVGAPIEALIVCLSVSILRKYSGGVHAHDIEYCMVLSLVYCTLTALASRWLVALYHPLLMAIAILLIYFAVYLIAYRYVPVDSPNKPIKTEKKIKRMRRGSFIIITSYLALQLLFYFVGQQQALMQSLGISLLFGIAWQAFTLTPLGAILLDKLNVLPKYLRKEVST